MADQEIHVDIRPESDIYATYRRLSYKPWYAIAEFVDNSTTSYFNHIPELQGAAGSKPYLVVDIYYDKKAGTLSVVDDAYGMEEDEFKRALQLAKPPPNIGRSEFGMGLKTAACWFGPRWRLTSSQLGSTREFTAAVDVSMLQAEKPQSIAIMVRDGVEADSHYTRLDIEGLDEYDRVFVGRTKTRIKEELGSIYRRDIRAGDIEITFDGAAIEWPEPVFLDENGTRRQQPIDLTIRGKRVTGWIGLLARGKAADTGFHQFRQGRLISGGNRQGWKPYDIFKAPNTYQSQRLIGELDFDDWGVAHTKDAVLMSGADEDELLSALVTITSDYVQKAREDYTTADQKKLSKAAAHHVAEESADSLKENERLGAEIAIVEEGIYPEPDPAEGEAIRELVEQAGDAIQISFGGTKFPTLMLVLLDTAHASEPLVRMGFPTQDSVEMVLNLNHPFVERFVGANDETMRALVHWLYVDALAERIQRQNPDMPPSTARLLKDGFLRTLEPLD